MADVDPDVSLNRPDYPIKDPRSSRKAEGEKLEDKNPEAAFVPNTEGKILMEFPIKWNTVEGVGDIRRTAPHGPQDRLGDDMHGLHSEFGNLNELVKLRKINDGTERTILLRNCKDDRIV